MARVASSVGPALIKQHDYSHIIDWYRETLPKTPPPRAFKWEPVRIGPTWDWTPERGWNLPKHSMGWELLGWCGYWLRDTKSQDWQFTPEQARFILHYDSLDELGQLLYRTAVFQRLKGHGKDPMACAIACAKAFAPTTFDHWGADGQPVGHEEHAAWVQIAAVSTEQTQNTMKMFPVMVKPEAKAHFGIQFGRRNVWGLGDTRQIQALARNFWAVEGNRPTQVIRNEPQNWNDSNQGHDMAGALEGNTTKIEGGVGRMLDIQNAFRPGEDSVAERVRDAWEATQDTADRRAKLTSVRMLMDSLEAHPKAPLTFEDAPEVLESVRGDSNWLNIPALTDSIAMGSNSPSESRRKWYNQIITAADGWVTPQEFDALFRDEWPEPGEPILIFGDGSKSDDHTAAAGVRISDGLVFRIGIWLPTKVPGPGGRDIVVPVNRGIVDKDLRETLDTYDVHGFWFDPSDARDDETGERYWEPYCDGWAKDYRRPLSRLPAVKTGMHAHQVVWDMRNAQNLKAFTEACERALTDMVGEKDSEGKVIGPSPTPLFHACPPPHVGGPGVRARQHVLNARRRPNKFGVSIGKEHRESRKKVDWAVCMVGARMMWHHFNTQGPSKGRAPGSGLVTTLR